MHQVWEDLCGSVSLAPWHGGDKGCEQTEEGGIGVNVVERRAVVNLRVVIQDVGVQAGVHSLARSTL